MPRHFLFMPLFTQVRGSTEFSEVQGVLRFLIASISVDDRQ